MIREGAPNVTLAYVSSSPTRIIGVNQYTDGMHKDSQLVMLLNGCV